MTAVSVIIPVYNVEKYIKNCIDSLIGQTLKDIEFIFIDDGSEDTSKEIIKEYQKQDNRIILIEQENKGVSCARNQGLKIANGEYIGFVDSDDWIESNYFEKLFETAKKYNADIATASAVRKREHNEKYRVHYTEEKVYTYLTDKIKICNIPEACYIWNKIYKRELIINSLFKEGVYFEDILWIPEIIKSSKTLVTVPNTLYYYRANTNSIVKKYSDKKQFDSYKAKKYINKFFEKNNIEIPQKQKGLTKKIKHFLGIPIIKIKEYNNIETVLLFGFLPILKKELNLGIKIKNNTFFIWEPCSKSHSEVVPGYAKYLLDLGYEVSVIVNPIHLKDGLFSRFKNSHLTINKISREKAKKFFNENNLEDAKGVLVTTAGKICDNVHFDQSFEHFAPDFDKSKLFLVEHDAKFAIDENLWNENIITLRRLNYQNKTSAVINPHYFGDIKITPKNDITNFVMIGSLSGKKMTQDVVINALCELVKKGYSDFKLTVIGKGSLKHVPKEIKKFIDIKGRLPFDKMYDELENADFILTSYNPQNPKHVFYNTTGTSGSFQLVYGFLKPCVILEEFASINGFTDDNSILYKTDVDYSKALIRGIEMSKDEYQKKQNNLKDYAENLYNTSLENFKKLLTERGCNNELI